MLQPRYSFWLAASVAVSSVLLVGCSSLPTSMPGLDRQAAPFSPADFDNTSMYTRHVNASQTKTCEAARRALLSQGYLVNTATDELVSGRKYFQPNNEIHYQVEMRVVCAPEGKSDEKTAAYASALQDRYVIKKINNSASLGVGAIGSLSLPVSATEDTLVKVGSETVADPRFYELFFQLFDRYVPVASKSAPSPNSESQARAIMDLQSDAGVQSYKPTRTQTPASPVTVEVVPIATPVTAPVTVQKAQPIQEAPLPELVAPEQPAAEAPAKAD
ncbi:DUF2242 domain-containing protein [Diaphorobacter sp. HDW4A]|uniref:DUF2242 domain-containing protein n=1 Tax=Diaphorobacter sp. HDW4A TaxID=2714924 RepID=UPI001409A6E7|nr:DUF2242 domain-containing protein [Diaphorobacter sp. HDW4A]QIL79136.1 DUF2242 domain-containing protein [Diaphorobacter sp. HDW4A]